MIRVSLRLCSAYDYCLVRDSVSLWLGVVVVRVYFMSGYRSCYCVCSVLVCLGFGSRSCSGIFMAVVYLVGGSVCGYCLFMAMVSLWLLYMYGWYVHF